MGAIQAKNIVIVDGYSMGRELAHDLKTMGAELFHLCSTPEPPPVFRAGIDATPYRADLGYLGAEDEAARMLLAMDIDHVLAGSEMGVSYAERLAHLVGAPTNLYPLVAERRNKFRMIAALHRRGLLAAEQALVGSENEAVAWAQRQGTWPLVVKPLDSAGSDNVTICRSFDEVRTACRKAFAAHTVFAQPNRQLIVQSWLDGTQYIVNTVSRDGRHFMTDAWRVNIRLLPGYAMVMEDFELLAPESRTASSLLRYTFDALDALGIVNGTAHSELKWTARGPAMIETGARLMGAAMDRDSYAAAGLKTQSIYHALDLMQPEWMNEMRRRSDRYLPGRHLTKVFFAFAGDGVITGVDGLERLLELPTFHAIYRTLPVGTRVHLTTDSTGWGGAIYLVHEDAALIERDREQIREWDAEGLLYEIDYETVEASAAAC
jgi:hypothetical protein